jgi:hypothetical protein
MRQVEVTVPPADEGEVLRLAEEHGALTPVAATVRAPAEGECSRVVASVPNDRVGAFVDAVEDAVESAGIVIHPRGVLPLRTPVGEVSEQLRSVSPRSALELVLGSLQSIGSWRGMLLYAVFAGLVGGYGVILSVPYLLTAAMLISPFGAPAMVSVVGIAVGDAAMFRRGTARFWAAAAVLAAAALLLGLAYGLRVSTPAMEQISSLSRFAVLLAVVGGAAGAQSQVQSDRDSLVTATATGFLVAVSLSPPAAVLGLSIAIGRWDCAGQMAFVLALTWTGILAGGWGALHLHGVTPARKTAGRGSGAVRWALLGAAVAATALLVAGQARLGAAFRKGDLAHHAVAHARAGVGEVAGVRLLHAEAAAVRPQLRVPGEGEPLLVRVVVERGAETAEGDVESRVREAVARRVGTAFPEVHPFVRVEILPLSTRLP